MVEKPWSAHVYGGKISRSSSIVNIGRSPTPAVVIKLLKLVHLPQNPHLLIWRADRSRKHVNDVTMDARVTAYESAHQK